MLETTALQLQGCNISSLADPALSRAGSSHPAPEPRRPVHERIGPQGAPAPQRRNLPSHDLWHRISEAGAKSAYHAQVIRESKAFDRFPCYSSRLKAVFFPPKFKPTNFTKYDGKIEPKQWLRVYSQAIELAGGDDDIKALFLPTALDSLPLS